ncbi:integrase core domain-containing protein [Salinibacter ruber]|uniref:integrase core domain-containing protein n=1 Tax=Salinibacter ruber TaxID=146919 RepID=UPI003C6DDB02
MRTILLEDGIRVSYSENGAKGNPWIETLWGRLKIEIGSRISEASSLPGLREVLTERFRNYNQERRHSMIGNKPPRQYLTETIDSPNFEERILAVS